MPENNPLFHLTKVALVVQNQFPYLQAHTGTWAN